MDAAVEKKDVELAREILLIKRLRVASAILAEAQEDCRPKLPRERPRRLSRLQLEYFEDVLGQYIRADDFDAFVLEKEREAQEVLSAQN